MDQKKERTKSSTTCNSNINFTSGDKCRYDEMTFEEYCINVILFVHSSDEFCRDSNVSCNLDLNI